MIEGYDWGLVDWIACATFFLPALIAGIVALVITIRDEFGRDD